MECIEDIIDTEEIPIDMLKGGKQFFGLKIKGNSMFPEYHHGDRVIIDESDINLTDGQIYAFRYDGQCYVKEINRAGNKIKCISINREYEPFFIEPDIDFKVFGRILPRIRL